MVINDVIGEIKNYKVASTHKAAFDIFKLLETNKELFIEKIDANNFNYLLFKFEQLTYGNPKDYNTESYKRDYATAYDLLLFYIDRIL